MVWNDRWYWCRQCKPHRRFASFTKLKQHRKDEHQAVPHPEGHGDRRCECPY